MMTLQIEKIFDDPDVYQSENRVGESIEDCVQSVYRLKYKCDYKVEFVRGEIAENVVYFKLTSRYKNAYDPIAEQSE